jgi:hypothetical protein
VWEHPPGAATEVEHRARALDRERHPRGADGIGELLRSPRTTPHPIRDSGRAGTGAQPSWRHDRGAGATDHERVGQLSHPPREPADRERRDEPASTHIGQDAAILADVDVTGCEIDPDPRVDSSYI